MSTATEPSAAAALQQLLGEIGLDAREFGGTFSFAGQEPLTPSRHRIAAANAAAIGAQAIGAATLWKLRGGEPQDVRVDLKRAVVPGLLPLNFLAQNGHSLRWSSKRRGASFFRAKDGRFVYVLHTIDYPDLLLRLLDFLDCSDAHDAIARVVARWESSELEEALAEKRLVGAVARTRDEWAAHPQGAWLGRQPAVAVEKIGDGDPLPLGRAQRPLEGLRVLDLGHILAGPTAARTLAEQGAHVLRISPPQNPDTNLMAMDTGVGKRSAFLDLDRPSDVETLRGLIAACDVIVQSWRPGALERRGFGPEQAMQLRPGIVYLSVSAYGDGGPWRERGGYDPVGQTVSGIAVDEGFPEQPRLVPTFTLNDYVAAYLGAAGVMGALVRRTREGGSYHVSVSLTRASMFVQSLGLLPSSAEKPAALPELDRAHLTRTRGPWGKLEHAAPIAEFSRTPGFWSSGAEPLGASAPAWW